MGLDQVVGVLPRLLVTDDVNHTRSTLFPSKLYLPGYLVDEFALVIELAIQVIRR